MAATRLIPMHQQKGKSLKQCIRERMDYAKNDMKTENGEYVSAYECVPESVVLDFAATKNEYGLKTGRMAGKNDVIAYQIRQAFKPGEVTAEEANRIGYETAMRWTKGKHAFIVVTHTDKAHIHNHIIYNSTTLDAEHKYKNFFLSSFALRRLSDIICLEHGLSVIEEKKPGEWQKRTVYPKRKSVRDEIREALDACMGKKPKDLDELLRLLEEMGYEIKRGKYISVRGADHKKFIRLRSLGKGYREDELEEYLSGKTGPGSVSGKIKTDEEDEPAHQSAEYGLEKLIDIQKIIAEGKGEGYVNWAEWHNIKQVAKALVYADENNLWDWEELKQKAKEVSEHFYEVSQRQKKIEARLSEISELKRHIFNYSKTRDAYEEYKSHGYSSRFFEEHREELTIHKAAKEAFSKLPGKIPKVKDLNEEYAKLLQEKKSNYAEYRRAKEEMRDLQTVKYNIEHFLNRRKGPERKRDGRIK